MCSVHDIFYLDSAKKVFFSIQILMEIDNARGGMEGMEECDATSKGVRCVLALSKY